MTRRAAQKPRGRRTVWVLAALAGTALLAGGALSLKKDSSLGEAAFEQAKAMVSLGPRPPGSAAHRTLETYIAGKLQAAGWAVEQDRFTADTPQGPVGMNNIVGRLQGPSDRVIILAAHYDTKWEPQFRFVGANDGASGTGLLLALAPVLAQRKHKHSLWLVFFDGEEAFQEWSAQDSLYGSRHFSEQFQEKGLVPQVGAFLLVDMIGDRDLEILREANSTPWLTDLVWRVAGRLGHARHFANTATSIEDDHLPLLRVGVPAVDLIDLNYGPGNRFHHAPDDTLDKISAASLQVVGEVLLETVAELER